MVLFPGIWVVRAGDLGLWFWGGEVNGRWVEE